MNIWEKALEQIDRHGWTQGMLQDADGRLCVMGALSHAAPALMLLSLSGTSNVSYVFGAAAATLFPGRTRSFRDSVSAVNRSSCWWATARFNDHPDTTEEDVRLVLKHLAAQDA